MKNQRLHVNGFQKIVFGVPNHLCSIYICRSIHSYNDSFVYYLKEYGYNTHSIGKCHFTPNYKELRGFNTREIQEEIINNPDDDDYLKFLYSEGYNYIIDPHGVRGDMYYIPQLSQMPQSHHPTEWIGDKILKFINNNKNKKP